MRVDATDVIAAFSDDLIDKRDQRIKQREYAKLEAAIVGPNRIEVRTKHIQRYSLFLNDRLMTRQNRSASGRTDNSPMMVPSQRHLRYCYVRHGSVTIPGSCFPFISRCWFQNRPHEHRGPAVARKPVKIVLAHPCVARIDFSRSRPGGVLFCGQ